MRKIVCLLLFFFVLFANAQENKILTSQIVEVSCGQCQFAMQGKSCDLAIRIDGKSYFVDGTSIDAHGDAHAKDGFCQAIRKAEVSGEIIDDRFKANYFTLLPKKE